MTRKPSLKSLITFAISLLALLILPAVLCPAVPRNANPLFQPPVNYDTGGQLPDAVVVADLNGDGKPDLIIANSGSSTVAVLLGNGDGTFQAAVNYAAGGVNLWPEFGSVAAADLNGDNKIDLVVTNSCISSTDCSSGTIGVLLGNGDGTFQPVVVYNSGAPAARSVAIADLNGDGKPDIVVANCGNLAACPGDGVVGVLLGNGDGTFKPAVTYDSGAPQAVSVAVADVNADGKPDILVANSSGTGRVSVLLGNGDGTFRASGGYASLNAQALAVADVNHDGKLDVVTANMENGGCDAGDGSVGVMLGDGKGTFASEVSYDSGGCFYIAHSVAVADVNGDGNPDLLVANYCASGGCSANGTVVGVLLGNGDGTFQPVNTYNTGSIFALGLAVADLNGDGAPDLVVVNNVNQVAVLLNVGPPLPTSTTLVSNVNPAPVHKLVTYTASLGTQHGKAATGTVAFQDGGTTIASVAVANNQAVYDIRYKTYGTHTITAAYSGDPGNQSSSSVPLLEEIRDDSKTVLTSSSPTSYVLQSVTFTATVSSKFGPIPDGDLVTFYDWPLPLASVPLAGGIAAYTITFQQAGEYRIKAVYAGDAEFGSNFDAVGQLVKKYPTTTTLVSSQNPSNYGQPVTFTVTVSSDGGPMPTGPVAIYDGNRTLAALALVGGSAHVTTSTLVARKHSIYATYWSDDYNRISRSPYLIQVVQK